MSLGTLTEVDNENQLAELLRAVDSMRAFVVDRMRGRPNEVDGVLQLVRETVWHRAHVYNPDLGCVNAFVFGITRNVVRRELSRRIPPVEELTDDLHEPKQPDPLHTLITRFDSHRWMRLVADFVGETDWALMVELALSDEDAVSVARLHGLTQRSLRTARDRVALTATTIRAALAAADADLPLTTSVIVQCVPVRGGLREVASMLTDDASTIAAKLGIHPGSARARIATAKRLLYVAQSVLEHEYAA
jgi:DNA-directed RNA polymerase specialized sigma24 family protein